MKRVAGNEVRRSSISFPVCTVQVGGASHLLCPDRHSHSAEGSEMAVVASSFLVDDVFSS